MNIFATHYDPEVCAVILDDKRVVKMIVESCQLLSSTLHYYGISEAPYKVTHFNHPCTKWVRSHRNNYKWLLRHLKYLISEYEFSFHNIRHSCRKHVYVFNKYISLPFDNVETTDFVNCSRFKDESDVHAAYRKTMLDKWESDKRFPRWYRRTMNLDKFKTVLDSNTNALWFTLGKNREQMTGNFEDILNEYTT